MQNENYTRRPDAQPSIGQQFAQAITKDDFILKLIGPGHSFSKHAQARRVSPMDRVLHDIRVKTFEQRFLNDPEATHAAASIFDTEGDCVEYIKTALQRNIEDIVDWLENQPNTREYNFNYITGDPIRGYGFKLLTDNSVPAIYEYKSKICHIALKKNAELNNPQRPLQINDIIIPTAYPLIMQDDTTTPDMITNDVIRVKATDLQLIAKQTPTYINSPATIRAWFDYIASDPILAVIPTPDNKLKIPTNDGHVIYVGQEPHGLWLSSAYKQATTLIQVIRQKDKYQRSQTTFFINDTVRDVLNQHHPVHLALADFLCQEIADKKDPATLNPMFHSKQVR